MFTVEISDNTADAIFKDILVQDYKGLITDIKKLEAKPMLTSYEFEDLKNNRKYAEALQTMLGYYLTHFERNVIFEELGIVINE